MKRTTARVKGQSSGHGRRQHRALTGIIGSASLSIDKVISRLLLRLRRRKQGKATWQDHHDVGEAWTGRCTLPNFIR